jgi:hypothetical protein
VRFKLNEGEAPLDKNNQDKQASDYGVGEETDLRLTRYIGAGKIGEMIENGQHIEAFTHTQLGVEKILWDRIVKIFEGEKAIKVREAIEKIWEEKDKSPASTSELIKWAHFLGAINDNEYSDLKDFNMKRNDIIHGHGQWYYPEKYKEALEKGIRFLRENGL